MATLLQTLSSDDETGPAPKDDSDSEEELEESFEFGGILGEDGGFGSGGGTTGWSYATALNNVTTNGPAAAVPRMDVAALIAAKRRALKSKSEAVDEDKEDGDADENDTEEESDSEISGSGSDDSDDESDSEDSQQPQDVDVLKTRVGKNNTREGASEEEGGSSSSEDEDMEETAKAAAFFDNESQQPGGQDMAVFSQLALSRPLLRGIAAMGFVKPTPIQAQVIPLALAGRDICASAVTGSGKTAAFLLPALEGMLHRYAGRTKALVLTPTRELAAQCLGMMTTFSQFTNLRACLVVGGAKNVNAQAAELRTRPDLIVATPGRLLDHVTNSQGVTLEDIEYLILDEADRLLDLGFQDEIHEIIKACPPNRQTLLFSATMNTKVDDLVKLSLKRPIRVRVNDGENQKDVEVAPRLEQEFVRIQAGNEGVNREGILLSLLTRTFTKQTIVFFDTKITAHRLMILCGLCGIKCAELHGNLTQQQRLTALEDFRKGEVDVLLATDLAARGLDIDSVKTVINFEMPSRVETYIHRIGRTARAGRGGRSCTLIGEGRRHLMKEIMKEAESKSKRAIKNGQKGVGGTGLIRSRSVPAGVVAHFAAKIQSLEGHVEEILQAEAVARLDRITEMEANKAQHIIEHYKEIQARPQREWFASGKQKKLTKEAAAEKQKMIQEKAGTGMHRMTRKKRRAREEREAMAQAVDNDEGDGEAAPPRVPNIKASARQAKREKTQKEKEAAAKSTREMDLERQVAAEKRSRSKVTTKHAAGDSSLFAEERVSYSAKKPKKEETPRAQSTYDFRGFDPAKKLGKKKGVKAFKSKAKHRRR